MGKTLMGGSEHTGNIDLLRPEQQQFLSGSLTGQGPAGQAYSQFLQPYSPENYEDVFQKSVIDPSMQTFEQQVLPSVQQRFVDANAGSSSALNQALGQSAQDLTTSLGSQYGQFFQNQQSNTLNALQQLGGLATQQTFTPMVEQNQGILSSLIGALGQAAGGPIGGGLAQGGFSGIMKLFGL